MTDTLLDRLDQAAAFLAAHHCDAKAIDDAKVEIVRLRAELASAVAAERERCARVDGSHSAKASYDQMADVLYVGIPKSTAAVCHDAKLDCLVRVDNGQIVGVTIVGFKEQSAAAIRKGG